MIDSMLTIFLLAIGLSMTAAGISGVVTVTISVILSKRMDKRRELHDDGST